MVFILKVVIGSFKLTVIRLFNGPITDCPITNYPTTNNKLSDKKLGGKLVENRGCFKPITFEEILLKYFDHRGQECVRTTKRITRHNVFNPHSTRLKNFKTV